MEPKEPLSYSRLGPMDPNKVRNEMAEELAAPAGTVRAGFQPRRYRRVRIRKTRQQGGGE
jgi:hypothetical protein